MLRTTRRILIGMLLGSLVGAIVAPITGYVTGLVSGGRTILLMGPLHVPSNVGAILLSASMMFFGPILGAIVGLITAAINRPRVGWLIGLLLGGILAGILTPVIATVVVGATTGLIVAVVVGRRLRAERATLLSTQRLRTILQTSADSYNRARLWLWIGFCLLLVLLGAFQLTTGDPILWPIWLIVMLLFAVGGIYFAYLLTLKKN